jgi:hypothetical protein
MGQVKMGKEFLCWRFDPAPNDLVKQSATKKCITPFFVSTTTTQLVALIRSYSERRNEI